MAQPKVSVVMPYWNRPYLVSNAIHSILDQTFEDFELIIVDDGSEDQEIDHIVRRFGDKRIRVLRTEHKGLVHARNYGNKHAKADIIMQQDSDDLSLPDRIEKLFPYMKDYDVVVSGLYINVWSDAQECISRLYIPALPIDKKRILKEQYLPGIPMYKKSVWKSNPFRMETQHAYDWMMWLDWIYSHFKIKYLNEGLYEYIRQESSCSIIFEKDGRRKQSFEKIKEIMKKEYGVTAMAS